MTRAVFLDRDGVINRALVRNGKAYPPPTLAECEILPGVAEAIADLRAAGFLMVIATNQPDVVAAPAYREVVEAIHERLRTELGLDIIKVCYHVEGDGCRCRKPLPGMLLEAAAEYEIDLPRSVMVGDRWRDIGAGRAAGCKTVLIDYGYRECEAESPDARVGSLWEASRLILDGAI